MKAARKNGYAPMQGMPLNNDKFM